MQEIYSALLLHAAKQAITVDAMKRVLEAAGASIDEGRIKAVVASLEGQNIDELLKQAVITAPPAVEKKEEEEEEEAKKKAEEAVAGLGALFG